MNVLGARAVTLHRGGAGIVPARPGCWCERL